MENSGESVIFVEYIGVSANLQLEHCHLIHLLVAVVAVTTTVVDPQAYRDAFANRGLIEVGGQTYSAGVRSS